MKPKPAKPVRLPKTQDLPETRLDDLIGCTGYRGPTKTLEDMEAGIAEGAARPEPPSGSGPL